MTASYRCPKTVEGFECLYPRDHAGPCAPYLAPATAYEIILAYSSRLTLENVRLREDVLRAEHYMRAVVADCDELCDDRDRAEKALAGMVTRDTLRSLGKVG